MAPRKKNNTRAPQNVTKKFHKVGSCESCQSDQVIKRAMIATPKKKMVWICTKCSDYVTKNVRTESF